MKPFLFCISAFFTISSLAQGITGKWQGFLTVGGNKIRFVMNLSKNGDNYQSSFDSPDQKVTGIPGSKTTLLSDSIHAEIAAMRSGYNGKWDGKDSITGVFNQGTNIMPLNMKRMTETELALLPKEKIRPQTPKPPYNYDSEEVEYDNADKTVHYGATLTKPRGLKSFPTVIIISGSGSQDRDGTILGHKLYWVLADYLTNHGIAVLRVDDRGTGKSTLGNNPAELTSQVFSTDVETSFNYLLSRNDLDKKKIGLIGHSEGGIIAPMVAARRKDIAFVLLWGAAAVGGAEINTQQNAYALRKAKIDSAAVDAFAQLHKKILSQFSKLTKEELDNKVTAMYADWKTTQSKETLAKLYATDNAIVGQDIRKMYHSLYDMAWMRYFISYNPSTDLQKISCPVLAINGMKDTQVDAVTNLAAIKEALTKGGNQHFQIKALPSLNHLLQTANTGDLSEYENIDETISPVAMNVMAEWIKNIRL